MDWFYDAFRGLSLLVVWAIPAILVLAIIAFTIFAPALTLTGMSINLYKILCTRLGSKGGVKMQSTNLACSANADCPPGLVCVNGRCMPVEPQAPV